MSHNKPDGESCKNYFKLGKSFPDNVRDALCGIDEAVGSTGPTGPAGPRGLGDGVSDPATLTDILGGINGTANDRTIPTYVDPSGWYHASNQYAPLVVSGSITNQTYVPDALNTNIFDLTHSGTCTVAPPVNMKNGRTISLILRQAGQGNNQITWDPAYHFDGGYGDITYTSGAKDVMVATQVNDFIFCTLAADVKPVVN